MRKKLNIFFLGGANSIHTLKWVKYFLEIGHKVHLASYDPLLKNYELGKINLYVLRRRILIRIWPFNTLLNFPFILWKVKKLVKKINPDIIHAHYVTSYGAIAALLGFHPFVLTAWGSDILVTPKKFLPSKWTVKYTLQKADLITCDAEHMKKTIMELGAEESKIKIINFGIDTKKFTPGPGDEELKKQLGISSDKVVISLRNLEPVYDIETLIRAAPLVFRETPKTKFLIVGAGSQEKELKKLSDDLRVSDNVKFLGRIPNTELPKYLKISDVYVSTSLSDGGISASTAEAMACQVPVIITDTGENKKWIEDGKDGFIILIKNPQILAEKIIYLLKNESERKKFGERGRKIIEERNDYYKEMAKMEQIYKTIIKN